MPDAAIEQRLHNERVVVGFDGVEDTTRKAFEKPLGRSLIHMWIHAINGMVGCSVLQHLRYIGVTVHERNCSRLIAV